MAVKQADVEDFLDEIKKNAATPPDVREKADQLSSNLKNSPIYQSDIYIYRIVVGVLGITVLATILGGLGLAFKGDIANYKLPSEIVAIGSAAVGALAGLLAPSPTSSTQ